MYRLSLLIIAFFAIAQVNGQKKAIHGPNFKMDCNKCHNEKGWKIEPSQSKFNHNSTGFQLEGQHSQINCKQCHASLEFSNAKTNCNQCHTDIHQSTLGNDCVRCHTTNNWLVNNITELHEQASFPIAGAHNVLNCIDCHKSNTNQKWERIGSECIDCHKSNFDASQRPNHTAANFSTNCTECHDPISNQWGGRDFHTQFPLTNGHAINDCNQCHQSGNYTSVSADCVSCHKDNFDATVNPSHIAAGFSTNCKECHNAAATNWSSGTAFHTAFPLTNSHAITDCNKCHSPTDFKSASSDCVSCHKDTYDATTNPNHGMAAIPTTCVDCHSAAATNWGVSTNFHNSFPLTLGHAVNDCAKCHKSGVYKNTSTDCVSCHLTDYATTSNPNHASLGFTTKCIDCHTTNPNWKPAKMENHDQLFPIYSGNHKGEWSKCTDCHLNVNNYSQFSCINCHEHSNQTQVTKDHNGVSGFVFESNACLQCHPRGED